MKPIGEIIAIFKEAGFSGRIYRNLTDVLNNQTEYEPIFCNGYKINIHPAVCEWHKIELDPKCKGCEQNEPKT